MKNELEELIDKLRYQIKLLELKNRELNTVIKSYREFAAKEII